MRDRQTDRQTETEPERQRERNKNEEKKKTDLIYLDPVQETMMCNQQNSINNKNDREALFDLKTSL